MYHPPKRGEEEMLTRVRVIALLVDEDRGLLYTIERLTDGQQADVPEQRLSAAAEPARATSTQERNEPPMEGKRDAPPGGPGHRAAGGAGLLEGDHQGLGDQLLALRNAVKIHKQLEEQRKRGHFID